MLSSIGLSVTLKFLSELDEANRFHLRKSWQQIINKWLDIFPDDISRDGKSKYDGL